MITLADMDDELAELGARLRRNLTMTIDELVEEERTERNPVSREFLAKQLAQYRSMLAKLDSDVAARAAA